MNSAESIGQTFSKVGKLIDKLNEGINTEKIFQSKGKPNPNAHILEYLMLGVHKEFRRLGIGRKLTEKSFRIAKALGCVAVKADAVNFKVQKLYEKLGLSTLKTIKPDEVLGPDGKALLKFDDETTCVKLMVKYID